MNGSAAVRWYVRRSRTPGSSSGTSDKVGELAERRVDLERRIELKREEIQQRRDEAVAFIYDIPDSLTRQIVYYRCVSLFGWTRVAYEVGGNNSPGRGAHDLQTGS